MQASQQKREIAERALERNLGWVRAADAKVPPLFAVDAAMLGVLGLRLPHFGEFSPLTTLVLAIAIALLLLSLVALGFVALPKLTGPPDSIVYFGTAALMGETTYLERLLAPDDVPLTEDLGRQAFRNAQIAIGKYENLARATLLLFAALPFWLVGIVATRIL